jgi:Na+/H+ antiporter NhaD/arsenite permease-like protein
LNLSVFTLLAVFLLIAIRTVGSVRLQIWHMMGAGALFVLVTGEITAADAIAAIDADVMVFLFCTFVIGQALEESGYLAHLSFAFFKRAQTVNALLIMVVIGSAGASGLLMNDTLAIVGTPVMLLLARNHSMSPKLLLYALMFSVTIGSVSSPIGNPQNLLIAINGNIPNPFITFLTWLLIPTCINLFFLYLFLIKLYPGDFHEMTLKHAQEPIRDHNLAMLAKLSLQVMLILIVGKILFGIFQIEAELRLTHIAAAAALPILIASPARLRIVQRIDWPTLAFFAAMFVLMESVWESGFFQDILARIDSPLTTYHAIIGVSVLMSQFISNVPLVALYQPLLTESGVLVPGLMALAAGSTIAGNLTILGAASNVIIVQGAEKRGYKEITLSGFVRIGGPLTLANAVVYWGYLEIIG